MIAILGYSYAKRFTTFSHLWLGLCLGIAPVGAWIAVTGQIGFASMVLSAAVIFWTAGFDIIYSLQDVEFDRKMALFSLPSRIGAVWALVISRLMHAAMVGLLVWFGVLTVRGVPYYIGAAIVGVFLILRAEPGVAQGHLAGQCRVFHYERLREPGHVGVRGDRCVPMIERVIEKSDVGDILRRALDGERLDLDDGVRLFASSDLHAIGCAANVIRRRHQRQIAHITW